MRDCLTVKVIGRYRYRWPEAVRGMLLFAADEVTWDEGGSES